MRASPVKIPERMIDVIEGGASARAGAIPFDLDRDFKCSPEKLAAFAFSKWDGILYDAMVVAGSIEYADRVVKRAAHVWERKIEVSIPVHDPARWNAPEVSDALHDALNCLTGDIWTITFKARKHAAPSPPQDYLSLTVPTEAIIAYSDGMDSRAVFRIKSAELGEKLLRVRVGSKAWDKPDSSKGQEPFTKLPYDVPCNMPGRENSSRSRGFRFAMITGIAAYLTDARQIIMPESGQGIFGPVLTRLGHMHADSRNHPRFTSRMEILLRSLLGAEIRYVFPRIWHTKGETLKELALLADTKDWQSTRSCWRNNQWVSVDGKLRQCGVCAACMLRRVSVHAAGLSEHHDTYVCADLSAAELRSGIDADFSRYSAAFEQYAIAGVQHMEHMAELAADDAKPLLRRHSWLIASALEMSQPDVEAKLGELFRKHATEWNGFMASVGARSFLRQWIRRR